MPSVRMLDSGLATYTSGNVQFNPVAAATDAWQLQVPAGTVAKVRWIEVGGTAAAARTQPVGLIRRSTFSTGGTSTSLVAALADSADGAAKSVVKQWTTLPGALGTAVATIDQTTFVLNVGTAIQDRAIFNYEAPTLKPIVLGNQNPSVLEALSVNFNIGAPVATIATDKLDFEIWWTEQ